MSDRPESVTLIAAVSRNGVIGRNGSLPWSLPDDLKFFKRTTIGHALIMGRGTYESLPVALPGRKLIVISSTMTDPPEGVTVVRDFDEALAGGRTAGGSFAPGWRGGVDLQARAAPGHEPDPHGRRNRR